MLIQCQACATRYRLDLQKIPERKAFVRCKVCGHPIYIDAEEEAPAQASLVSEPIAPTPSQVQDAALAESRDGDLVQCPECHSRYRVPQEPLSRPGIRLKCTMCGHVFVPHRGESRPPGLPTSEQELFPHTESGMEETSAAGVAAPPEPDDVRMQGLFDDLREEPAKPHVSRDVTPPEVQEVARPQQPREPAEPASAAAEPVPPSPAAVDPEHAYLAAVSLEDEAPGPGAAARAIPGAQKYKLFLNPQEYIPGTASAPAPTESAEPPLPPVEPPAAEGEAAAAGSGPAPLREPDDAGARLAAGAPSPVSRPVPPDRYAWLTEHRRIVLLGAVGCLVLVVVAAWIVWLLQKREPAQLFALEFGKVHQLQLDEAVQGSYVVNQPSGARIFVLQGSVVNRFPQERQISWVRVRGTAYADREQTRSLATASAYLGNVLSEQQLQSWTPEAITAYAAYNNGRNNSNVSIATGARVPYQLVFVTGGQPVMSTTSQVISYYRDGVAIYLDTGSAAPPH
ncbi:MAG TPA: zinc-ribbon domain-containing protein [bacterium]|nr:zinc-ribbon domain-containing protein [bacterium]